MHFPKHSNLVLFVSVCENSYKFFNVEQHESNVQKNLHQLFNYDTSRPSQHIFFVVLSTFTELEFSCSVRVLISISNNSFDLNLICKLEAGPNIEIN